MDLVVRLAGISPAKREGLFRQLMAPAARPLFPAVRSRGLRRLCEEKKDAGQMAGPGRPQWQRDCRYANDFAAERNWPRAP